LLIKAFCKSSGVIFLLEWGILYKSKIFIKFSYTSEDCYPKVGGYNKKLIAWESLLNFLESLSKTFPFYKLLNNIPVSEIIKSLKVSISTPIIIPAVYVPIISGPALYLERVGSLALSVDNESKADININASSKLSILFNASLTSSFLMLSLFLT